MRQAVFGGAASLVIAPNGFAGSGKRVQSHLGWHYQEPAVNRSAQRAITCADFEPLGYKGISGGLGDGNRCPAGRRHSGRIGLIACPQGPPFLKEEDAFFL